MSASKKSIEQLNREYQSKLAEAAKREFTNEELVREWLNAIEAEVVKETIDSWKKCSKHLLEFLASKKIHLLSIDRLEAQRYAKWVEVAPYAGRIKKEPLAAASVLLHILQGSSLFNHLVDVRGLALQNPFYPLIRVFKRKRRSELRPDLRALDEREVALLLEGCESLDEFLLVLVLVKTGVRRGEFAAIKMANIDWEARTIKLDPHPRRTHLKAYFDEELEYFLKLKCQRNARDYPGNPYLWPSPQGKNNHFVANQFCKWLYRILKNSPLRASVKDHASRVTPHTFRRSFTSVLKRKRATAPAGCPSHIVAVLRGDSLLSRNENTPDPTQGYYTKMGQIDGVPEVRYWYDKCMPTVGAREVWERAFPGRGGARSVAGLIRSTRSSRT